MRDGNDNSAGSSSDRPVSSSRPSSLWGASSVGASSLLTNVVGETKRVLSTIVGHVVHLQNEALGDEGIAALNLIDADAERLMRLLENAVDFERLELGLLSLTEGPFSPRSVASNVDFEVDELARRNKVQVSLQVEDNVPEAVFGDAELMQRMLVEFVTNAIEFSERGKVSLRVYRTPSKSLDEIHYEIIDSGKGIPGRKLALVFEPFYRVAKESAGGGLGLSICRDLVNLMGGRINLTTSPEGTKVTVTLAQPAVFDQEASSLDDAPVERRKSLRSLSLTKPRVLVVEDDPDNRRLIARLIEAAGYEVEVSGEGQHALTMLRQTDYDVLVTDISMPKMDGIELVSTWRREEAMMGRRRTPAVMLTAHATSDYQLQCRQAGVDVFLTKPVKGISLRRALAKIGHGVGRVLVLDPADEPRLALEACLDSFTLPLRIESVRTQNEAIAACLREKFSLIFIQVDTAHYQSQDVLREIRPLPGFLRVPCIGYGNHGSPADGSSLAKIGFSDVLSQPLDRQQVHRTVRQHLRSASIDVRTTPSILRDPQNYPTLLELTLPSAALKVNLNPDSRDLLPEFLEGIRENLFELKNLIETQQFSIVAAIATNMRVSGRLHQFEEVSAIGARLEQAASRSDLNWGLQLCERLASFLDEMQISGVQDPEKRSKT